MKRHWFASMVILIVLVASLGNPAAFAKDRGRTRAHGHGNVFTLSTSKIHGGPDLSHKGVPSGLDRINALKTHYVWKPACVGGAYTCPPSPCKNGDVEWRYWAITPTAAHPTNSTCAPADRPPRAAPRPTVTAAMVARAFQQIPVPSFRSIAQPGGKTLVNFDTIFHADARPFTRTITLLGQRVRLHITPSSFRWNHGDGTITTTHEPGAAYPSKDIVYRYQQAHVTVEHSLAITWTATWSLNGGAARPVLGTVTTSGAPTPLRIAEAVPALSGSGH